MSLGRLEDEMVDIYQYPEITRQHDAGKRVVYGDLDGNVMKMMHFLIKEGVVEVSEAFRGDYSGRLLDVYRSGTIREREGGRYDPLNQAQLDFFYDWLQEMNAKDSGPAVLFIGDDLADRGSNDLLMLQQYKRLMEIGVRYNVIASNHGLDFLRQVLSKGGVAGTPVALYLPSSYYAHSLESLRQAIQDELISTYAVDIFVSRHYIDKIKLLACDRDEHGVILYTHAPVHPQQVRDMFCELQSILLAEDRISTKDKINIGVEKFNGDTPEAFMHSVEIMNTWFQMALRAAANDKKTYDNVFMYRGRIDDFVNGRYGELQKSESFGQYPVVNVHGHVGDEGIGKSFKPLRKKNVSEGWSYVNLDGTVGMKMPLQEYSDETDEKYIGQDGNKGAYKVFVAQIKPGVALTETAPPKPVHSAQVSNSYFRALQAPQSKTVEKKEEPEKGAPGLTRRGDRDSSDS